MEIYTEHDVQKLHEEYWNLYENENYFFMGAMDVFVPMLVFNAGFSYVGKTNLTVIENFVCRLIEKEIHSVEDMAFVLGVNERIIDKVVQNLILSGIVEGDNQIKGKIVGNQDLAVDCNKEMHKKAVQNRTLSDTSDSNKEIQNKTVQNAAVFESLVQENKEYYMTESGRQLFKSNEKISIEKEQLRLFFNTVSGNLEEGNNLELVQQVSDEYLKLDSYYLPQNNDKETEKLLLPQLQVMYLDKNQFKDLTIGKKELYYKKYHMMLYRMENRPSLRFVLYDFSKKMFDTSVSKKIQDMYAAKKLPRMMEIIQQAQEGIFYLSDIEQRLRIKPVNIRYVMNKEIRELVKKLFTVAKESVFIVSPWINDSEYVISEEFLAGMEKALAKKEFTVTIAYGYKNEKEIKDLTDRYINRQITQKDREYRDNKKDIHSELAARRLKKRFAKYSNFEMIFRNTHEKILCYDKRVSVVGSFNYFSYDGGESCNYEGSFFRKEGAVIIEDEKFAGELLRMVKDSS